MRSCARQARYEGDFLMKRGKKALLAAGLLAGAAAMTGCAGTTRPAATPKPAATAAPSERATAAPATAAPDTAAPATAEPQADDAGGGTSEGAQEDQEAGPIPLRVDGRQAKSGALLEEGVTMLPVVETAELLGWKAAQESVQDGALERYTIALERDESRITIAWTVSDNTIRQITWQRDGLLVPVDARLTSEADVIYAPAAFFEEATGARVNRTQEGVSVLPPETKQTPATQAAQGE